jgi:hypothetical protein
MQVIVVRNNHEGPSVFSDDGPPKVAIEWLGKGDPTGGDIQEVPSTLADNINFRRAVSRGVFEIVEADEEVMAKLAGNATSWRDRQAASNAAAMASIDQAKDEDIIQMTCVGPGTRPGATCDQPVPVRERNKNEAPPLCSVHESLKGQFLPVEGEVGPDGKASRKWARVGMSEREHQTADQSSLSPIIT